MIILLLGLVHLASSVRGDKLNPRDPELTRKMMTISPRISSETTMWRAWVGFNVSHSLCLILFGSVYCYLATRHSAFLFHSSFLLVVGLVLLLSYAVLAKLYWFTAPFIGVTLATLLYLLGIIANLMWPTAD